MCEELDAIQHDLDAVLDRLAEHVRDKPDSAERLASLLYRYSLDRDSCADCKLETAMHLDNVQRNTEARFRQIHEATYGSRKGDLLAAIGSIRDQRSWKGPLSRWAIEVLAEPAERYVRKIDHYFGEYAGEDLLRHRGRGQVNPRRNDMAIALNMIFELCREDPDNNKLSRKSVHKNVFEKVAKKMHLGEADIERHWRESHYPEFLRVHRLRKKHGTTILDEIEGRAPYSQP
ncbi:hypothetical protein [Halomonas dongshanensis]|uniref:Uncharacterized protein n=1 Tax=Halomonas dongshanensis TaxID=2890835 RepID=A0ABT2EFJ1_9GAMM|nr:hypothetical protein [Halomonas dongshanensis]MCS2609382.1 hypothetical protein [Halomonas dongshanensis]